jgi:hypothetical protein
MDMVCFGLFENAPCLWHSGLVGYMFFSRDESCGYKIAHACGILFFLMDLVLWPGVQAQVPIGTAEFVTPGFIPVANKPTPPQECQRHATAVTGEVFGNAFMGAGSFGLFENAPCLFSDCNTFPVCFAIWIILY